MVKEFLTTPNHVQPCPARDQNLPGSPPSFFFFGVKGRGRAWLEAIGQVQPWPYHIIIWRTQTSGYAKVGVVVIITQYDRTTSKLLATVLFVVNLYYHKKTDWKRVPQNWKECWNSYCHADLECTMQPLCKLGARCASYVQTIEDMHDTHQWL